MSNQMILGRRAMRLALCATVVGAALSAQTAYAAVIEVNFTGNAFSTVPFNLDGFYLNVVTGATGTTGTSTAGWDLNPYFVGSTTANPGFRFFTPTGGGFVGAAGVATPLGAGAVIGATSTFITGVVNGQQSVAPTINNFGFRFLNEATGVTNYGYVTIQQLSSPVAAGSIRVLGYAYEDTGAAISVVPEPSTWLMMLGGVAALGAFARRRAGQQAA